MGKNLTYQQKVNILLKGTNLTKPPTKSVILKDWIKTQGIEEDRLDYRSKQILLKAGDKAIKVPIWQDIENV